ncbi:MAG: MBL fold metallo-hydrolase [Vicinamibacterales bacterium]|nr:MBL fold metallo-hydrolase [Vicinamibacterales bacterium]
MNSIARLTLAAAILLWSPADSRAQTPNTITPDLARLTDGRSGQVFNRALAAAAESGRTVARLDARAGDGGVLLEGIQLSEGVIEVDLKGKDVAQQSFLGIAFHVVDWTMLDAVYFRPFNFRGASAEQRSHAVQYVSHPANTWQRLRTERPGQFEQAIDPPPDPNGWLHARIVLAGGRVEVFVNGGAKPSLSVEDLGSAKSGGVALWAGNGSDGAFANLRITPTAPAGPPPASSQNIFQASSTGNLARLRTLVEADPKLVGARNPNGFTALHAAALYGQRATADYLLGRGADPNVVAKHSGTPLDVAYEAGQTEFVAWLEPQGARFTPLRFDVVQVAPAIRRVAFPWGMMNNVVVFSGTGGAVVIDTGFSTRAIPELKRLIAGWSAPGITYVVNTHAHGDHVAGNAMAPSPQAVITAASLSAGHPGLPVTREAEPLKGRSGRTLPAPYAWRVGGSDIKLIPRPGLHSDADLIVYFPAERVVDMGDLLLSESVPAVEDIAGYLTFLDDALDVFPEDATYISGHGRDLDAAGVRAYRDTLKAMGEIIRTNVAAGKTAEQMVKDDVLRAYKAKYSLLEFLAPDALTLK